MSATFVPADQAQRERIARALEETLFVEAGAGTGKTTALVSRIVALLASGRATIDGIAAITFTEAAAAELREKVRHALEEEARRPDQDEDGRRRCLQSARGLEGASIQTLHSFAGALLRERPLEAGLPPAFDIGEEIAADLSFEEQWQRWLDRALESSEITPHLRRALGLGLRLEDLHAVTRAFHGNYDLLMRPFPRAEEVPWRAGRAVIEATGRIRRLLPLARKGLEDPLVSHAGRVAALGDRLEALGAETEASMLLLARQEKLSCSKGNQSHWDVDPGTKKNGCKALKELLKEIEEIRAGEIQAFCRVAFLPLLEELRRFVLDYAGERRRSGRAEFHDLLVWARDLLRDHPEARAHFRRRFSHILIDEFQDTDPIQAEIAFFLAGDPAVEGSTAGEGADWRQMKVVPGRLFVVGDPKQSIYRFRRADIAALEQVRGLLGHQTIPLVQNFRSQETVLSWVNALFGQWMGEGTPGLQAPYLELAARWSPPAATPPLGVHWLGGPREAPAAQVRQEEALALADLLRDMQSAPWSVRTGKSAALWPARYQDICLLLPTRTGLRALEQVLDGAKIPYRVESQSLVLGTQDVRDLLHCLRAIDAPADRVALATALRSPAFGCSDVELLQFVEEGGRFDYLDPGTAAGPVREALEVLHRYHRERVWEAPRELIERFVRERRMVEACFGRARPRERWRRLRFIIERAHAFARVGGSSLRGFLDWIERQAQEGARVIEVPVPEADEDAVRIMTIHAAKGLEFPIVVLAGLGTQPNHHPGPALFDRETGSVEVRLGGLEGFATSGYPAAREREKEAERAEAIRLIYVATTRARDHLVVSLFHHPTRGKNSHAAAIDQIASRRPDLWHEVSSRTAREAPVTALPQGTDEDTRADREAWQKRRAAVLRRASRPAAVAVTRLAQVNKEEAEDGEVSYRRGRGGGTHLGRAVHSVLQSLDLATGAGMEEISRAQAAAEGIADRWREVAALVRKGLKSPIVRRAVASGRYQREVFVSLPLDDGLLEGFIDLLFEEDGGWVIVDYKTDLLEEEELQGAQERYALQAGAYGMAVQEATGKPVREAILVFLHPNEEVALGNIQGLLSRAQERARSLLSSIQ